MKTRILVLLALMALALPAAAESLELHVLAVWEGPYDVNAAEFGFGNLPFDQCYIEEEWDTDLVIGGIAEGWVALAFTDPLPAYHVAHLGLLRFTCLEPLGDDYAIAITESINGNLVLVDADSWEEFPVGGGCFFFNPSDWGYDCYQFCDNSGYGAIGLFLDEDGQWLFCSELLPETTPAEASNWGSIKALY